jgi:glutathione synthase/RimK-type ligase-like ATP-grasp enzyme
MMFQEQIPKALELRVVIVGNELFAAAIASQKFEQSRYDWRRQVLSLVDDWQPYSLPQEVEAKLLSMMNYFGLNYGAIDLILTPDNRYVFLEINPCGEFSWLDHAVGLPISQAIANLLLRQSHNTIPENRKEIS